MANPVFWVWALRDPAGASLDRIQVIKGWIEKGEKRQSVHYVLCSGERVPGGSGRLPNHCRDGGPHLVRAPRQFRRERTQVAFKDPAFRAEQNAFYYVRVLENPSCRWTTWLANSAGVKLPDDLPPTEQQRAWSSPIWARPIAPQ